MGALGSDGSSGLSSPAPTIGLIILWLCLMSEPANGSFCVSLSSINKEEDLWNTHTHPSTVFVRTFIGIM